MNIHFILQGKGGVGKSFISVLLTQFLTSKNKNVVCIDTDPNNASFFAFSELNVKRIQILNDDNEIEQAKFDGLIEEIIASTEAGASDLVIDSGSSCYINFSTYLLQNEVFTMLKDMGHNVIIHTVVVGGQGALESITSLNQMCKNYRFFEIPLYVWINSFVGEVKIDGKSFAELKIYANNKDVIAGYIEMPMYKNEFRKDLDEVMTNHITFTTAINSDNYKLMQKQRLKTMQRKFYEVIEPFFN